MEDQVDFQDMPALRYESGCWPVPYEIVIDRGRLVIALFYLRDYPIDLEADFNQILASLEFYEPALPIAKSPAPPTPIVCLDEQAEPLDVPARQAPLEVRFLSDGDIWVWEQAGSARQISDTGDASRFIFSPDGEVIAFERPIGGYPNGEYKIELWAINRNGEGLRRLVSADQFDEFLTGRHEAWMANVPTDYRWLSGTHQLTFGVYPYINAIGGGDAAEGYWVVDLDTLALEKWVNPEAIDPYGPEEIASPDGKVIALIDQASISLRVRRQSHPGLAGRRHIRLAPSTLPGWGPPAGDRLRQRRDGDPPRRGRPERGGLRHQPRHGGGGGGPTLGSPGAERVSWVASAAGTLAEAVTGPFDGAYSNFGPLNCEPDLTAVARQLGSLLRPGSVLACSVMNRVCAWEIGWGLLRLRPRQATRRLRRGWVHARMSGAPGDSPSTVPVRYYSPGEFARTFAPDFSIVAVAGFPVLIPPPYLARRFPGSPQRVGGIERRLRTWPLLRSIGDHFWIALRRN